MEEFLKQEWTSILESMKKDFEIGDLTYNTFLLPLKIHSVEGDTVTITSSENSVGIDYVKRKYANALKFSISAAVGKEIQINLETADNLEVKEPVAQKKINCQAFNLNPKYTFDTFVVGDNNRHAHALSLAVAESPGQIYNPLFLYGGVGLGKTHLMHAIAHYIIENNPELKVLYTTCEDFTNELIESLKNQKVSNSEFRAKYRNIDVLLIDDIQFLIGKEGTQEEFFHTFNALTSANKAVIICSDRPPKDLVTLNERLVSRFEMGALTDIQVPTYETKMAILSKKEEMEGFTVPNEVKSYIANNINSSIRQLEGALTNLFSYSKIAKTDITVELAERVLKDVISPNEQRHATTPEDILSIVAEHYSISPEDIISQKRNAKITAARQIVMYLCRELIGTPLQGIGAFLGNRDHSTIIHGITKIENEIQNDPVFATTIDVIKKKINPY
ncbi:MAG: chromosomal replication initiator protein DnaA [Lachnospiraceae bacterium]